jgi:hypothetical protein
MAPRDGPSPTRGVAQSTRVIVIHLASALYILVVGTAADYVLVSGMVHGGNVIWALLGAVVAAMAARVLWMVGHSAIQARRWLLAQRPPPSV